MDFSPDYILSNFIEDVNDIEIMKKNIFRTEEWNKLDQGLATFDEVLETTKENLPERLHEVCERFFNEWHLHKKENKEMTKLIKELKELEYGIYLCSNAASRFYSYKNRYPVFKYFDDIVISADIKKSKPDQEIYEYVLKKNKLNPDDCLFIDDLNENIISAEKLGISGYQFNGNTNLFRNFLQNINIL